jgi:GntR family transcriptional repressor for pyruvate dehydrogenase complex
MLEPIKAEKLYNIIIRKITDLIDEEKLGPGDRLPSERDLAAALCVSRASVRQAIVALSAKGIIVMRQGDGNYVSDPTEGKHTLELLGQYLAGSQVDPDAILEVRLLVECEASRLSAIRATDTQIEKLKEIIGRKKLADQNPDVSVNFNKELHFAIAEGAQNKALLRIMEVVWDIMGSNMWPLLKQESVNKHQQKVIHWIQHGEIVNAIIEHNADLAYKAMYNHLFNVKEGIDDVISKPENMGYAHVVEKD